jgi:isopentenyldiphosphate isomerase
MFVIQCFEENALNHIANITIDSSRQSSFILDCIGSISLYESMPLIELASQLCINTYGCNVSDIFFHSSESIILPHLNLENLSPKPTDEVIGWIGTKREPIMALPRRLVHKYNMLHRGFGALLIHSKTQDIFVHKRAATKRIFPSMLDMFIGGVPLYKETVMNCLIRELEEEVGVDLRDTELPVLDYAKPNRGQRDSLIARKSSDLKIISETSIVYLGEITVKTALNHCLVDCFAVRLAPMHADNIQFRDGEVEWGEWMSLSKLLALLEGEGEQRFVPDGLQVWKALPKMIADKGWSFE